MQAPSELPKWFTPLRMLCIFTCMSTIVYLDRGLIASTPVNGRRATVKHEGAGIQGAFDLTNFEDGCLPAAFMAGLLVSAPIFVHFSATVEPFKLVGIGLLIWFTSVFSCGLTWGFWSLLICRTVVGVGEASFVILAAPFINQYAPSHLKSVWLAIFLMAIPVGYAIGYIYGAIVGTLLGWRGAFMSAAALMLPFAVFAFLTKPVPLGKDALNGSSDVGGDGWMPHTDAPLHAHADPVEDPAVLAAAATAFGDDGDVVVAAIGKEEDDKAELLEAAMERSDGHGAAGTLRSRRCNGSGAAEAGVAEGGALTWDVPSSRDGMRRQTLWLLGCAHAMLCCHG
eukprot:jgi/Ulvmu1/10826/UM069_0063.1